ncbi:MAG: efflux RND transporter periplasmic adaptor subunit [Eubacterium sp.]
MATVKKNNKKKIIIPICLVLVIVLILGSISSQNYAKYGQFKLITSGEEVTLTSISTDDIIETVSATGDITAGATREYKVGAVADVKEVFVKVGDEVKKGDTLATFDTENLDDQVKSLQTTYNNAKESYDSASASQKEAQKQLDSVNSQIPALEKKVAAYEAEAEKEVKAEAEAAAAASKGSGSSKSATVNASFGESGYESSYDDILDNLTQITESLSQIADTIAELTDSVKTMNALLQTLTDTITEAIESGDYDADSIAEKCGDAMAKAIKEGLIDETTLIIESGVAVDMVEAAVKNIDFEQMAKSIEQTDSVQLTTAQLQLAALYAEREIFKASADMTTVNAQKQVVDTAADALETVKEAQQELSAGWTASMDGVITQCNIVEGGQTTLLETGITLENMDTMVATISLGEYDIHKVKVGMPATIKTAYGEYQGEIATIAPTATGGSSGSILDSVGSMAGISGLSSLTSTGAGVECTITIDNPDENIIVGFEASVDIVTGEFNDVPCVPVESIVLAKDGSYVYLYNEEDQTVTKTKIETGATSDNAYEIKSGLSVGDKIVATPGTDYEEDTFKVLIPKQ